MKRKRILTDEQYAAREKQNNPGEPQLQKPTASQAGPIATRPDEKPLPVGRPTGYSTKYPDIARKLCEMGATDADLADAFGVSTSTIWNWRSQFKPFLTAISEARQDVFDPLIERSLAQRALGYQIDTIEKKVLADGSLVTYPVRKYIPPDTQAIRYWLNNRKPKEYRERHEVTGPNNGPVQVLSLDPKQLAGMSEQELEVLDKALGRIGGDGPTLDLKPTGDANAYAALLEGPTDGE